jgi:hypothetical protein
MAASNSPTRSRRKRLIVRYAALSLGLVCVVTAGVVLLLREPGGAYRPGGPVAGVTNELAREIPADYPRVTFSDATTEAGIRFQHFAGKRSTQLPEDMGSGAAWGDYDNDGDDDLYICGIAGPLGEKDEALAASTGGNRLYRNNGDGTFTDVTAAAGVGFKGIGMAAAWADYDNDGTLDLVVTGYGRLLLYRNLGNGVFSDVSQTAGFAGRKGFWAGVSWGDYDRDGRVDLYICGYVRYGAAAGNAGQTSMQYSQVIPFTLNPSSYPPEGNLLFRNDGGGRFSEVSRVADVENGSGRSLSAAWADFDRDGWLDLYVANDVSDNAMYRNRGGGTFEDVSHPAWAADFRGAMGLAVGDWDRDSDFDIFVTHWIAQENGFYWNFLFNKETTAPSPTLKFTDIADMMGLGQISLNLVGWGTSFFDYDNDGKLDLFAANGSTFQQESDPSRLVPMQNHLYWQKGQEEGFFEVGSVSGKIFEMPRVGRGAAFSDYDNDGDVDLIVVNHGDPPTLLRNDGGNSGNWLIVRARGTQSIRSALGAIVEIETERGKQVQQIGSQSSYLSQNSFAAHFGLGQVPEVRAVSVTFPSGVVRNRAAVRANQTILIEE